MATVVIANKQKAFISSLHSLLPQKHAHDPCIYERLLNKTHDSIIIRDSSADEILFWNLGAVAMYGYTEHEALGKNPAKLLKTKYPISYARLKRELAKNGFWEGELVHTAKDGREVAVLSRWSTETNRNGQVIATIIVTTDITKQKEVEKRKDEFISMASHELKTPLSAIKVFSQILEKSVSLYQDKKILYFVSKMGIQVNKLTKMINEMLDISRIQSGKLDVKMNKFDFDDLVTEIIVDFQHTVSTHQVIRRGEVNGTVYGDRERITQVFVNLINNAIKFSPKKDMVIVETKIQKKKSTTNQQVVVSIKDFGIGISRKDQKKIFEKFYRVEALKNIPSPGLGMGLHISNEIIKRHKGKMWLKSTPREGSTFYFSLPIYSYSKTKNV